MKKARGSLIRRSGLAMLLVGLTACGAILGGDQGNLNPLVTNADGGTSAPAASHPALSTESGEDARFRWNKETVADKKVDLTWQRAAPSNRMAWEDAQTYCSELGLAGGHWRLPTKSEMLGLVALDQGAYPFTVAAEWYWTSTRSTNVRSAAWAVGVGRYTNTNTNEALSSLRCVR